MRSIINKIIQTDNKDESIFRKSNSIYTFLNPVSYLESRKYKSIFDTFDGIFVDGSILIAFIKLFYKKKITRQSFDMTSIVPKLFTFSSDNNSSLYIVGSTQEEIEISISIFKKKFPKLNIIGYRNGFFNEEELYEEYVNIINLDPDFLIIGMGIIHQEKFLLSIKNKGYKGIGFTCGGFISQTAKEKSNYTKINYYPNWINKYNLRFIYRIYKEKHTRSRYFKAGFIFPFIFIKDKYIKS